MVEIVDLRRALKYLITRRDVEELYSNKPETSSTQPKDVSSGRLRKRDEELTAIPNLVNRTLMEHYNSKSTNSPSLVDNNKWTKQQKNTVTQLLLAVIIEFSEPYFIRMTLREEQERLNLLQKQRNDKEKTTKSNGASSRQHCSLDTDVKFDNRAVAWATSCIHQLLQQPQQSVGLDLTGAKGHVNSNNNNNNDNNDYSIPELDALLAASGPHDGLPMQERIQCALMNGLNGRRLLRRNISYKMNTN
jgi:hypothetical protein